jgi:hypothetical protein
MAWIIFATATSQLRDDAQIRPRKRRLAGEQQNAALDQGYGGRDLRVKDVAI